MLPTKLVSIEQTTNNSRKTLNGMMYIYFMFLVNSYLNVARAAESASPDQNIPYFTEDTHMLHKFNSSRTSISDNFEEASRHARRRLSLWCVDSHGMGATDSAGNDCNTYWSDACNVCGLTDDDDFIAATHCCPCNGGTNCNSNDNGETDSNGNNCQAYHDNSALCDTNADDDDFTAASLCCPCGGGTAVQSGTASCENQGLDENSCMDPGCCTWTGSACESAVGSNPCIASSCGGGGGSDPTGVESCENLGLDSNSCMDPGCCTWTGSACESAVGTELCSSADQGGGGSDPTGVESCENLGLDSNSCMDPGCCTWTGSTCVSAVGTELCSSANQGGGDGDLTGVQSCENLGWDSNSCFDPGCCTWTGSTCVSAVGTELCSSANQGDGGGNGDNNGDNSGSSSVDVGQYEDSRGKHCYDYYNGNEGDCGNYDDGDFIAALFCAACNGGGTTSSDFVKPTNLYCKDTDSTSGVVRIHCSDFNDYPSMCSNPNLGSMNLNGFSPGSMCCACGGGITTDPDPVSSWLTEGLLCRKSDYRTLASHPEWDVTSVRADVSESGYLMLMTVTYSQKSSPSTLNTFIYVLNGWECKAAARREIEFGTTNVVQAIVADPWQYEYYQVAMLVPDETPPVQEAFEFRFCLHVLTENSSSGFKLSIYMGAAAQPSKTYQIDLSSSLNYVPQSLQANDFIVYFATTDKLFKMDFTANTNAITLDMTQVLQTAISDLNYRFAVDLISSVLHVKIIDSTNTMRLNMQLNHSVASTPVVRFGQSVTEGSLVMCTYEANSSTNNVYFDQVALNGDTISFSTTTWAQCLAAIGPTSTVSNALFLLMQADLMVKTVKINFSSGLILTKSSAAALQNFLSFDATSTTAYGILFHEEQFIFGVTSHVYDKALTGNGGFLTSLENYRLNDFYTGDYASDADISPNSVSTTSVQSTEAVTAGSISCDVQTTTYTTDTTNEELKSVYQFTVDRHGYIAATCTIPAKPVSELLFCLLDGSTWEQRCIWDPVDLSQYEKAYADVCFPFWFKDEIPKGQGTGQAFGMVYEDNGFLKPAAFKSFALTFNGKSQLSRTNDDPINTIGEGLWMSLNMNDRWNTDGKVDVVVYSPYYVLIARHDTVFGISENYPVLDFLTEELVEKYQPVLQFCRDSTILPMSDEGLDGSCMTESSLSDGTMVGDLSWKEFKKLDWFKWHSDPSWSPDTRIQSRQFQSLPKDQQNLVLDLIAAQTLWFDAECKNELPYVSYNSNHREVQIQDLNIRGFKIDGEKSKDWKCFATYFAFCFWKTSSDNSFQSWTLTYFSPPSQEIIEVDEDDYEEEEEDKAIEINKPWAEFYLENLESGRWVMDPPSLEQILGSELEASQIAILMSRLYPDYQPEQDPESTDDDDNSEAPTNVLLTQDQITEAKSQAQYRADNDEFQRDDPVTLQYDINQDGILAIQFSRTVIMPKYMLDLINEAMDTSSAEDPNQDQATESDPTAGEENVDQEAESDPTVEGENVDQATESDQATEDENVENQNTETDLLAEEQVTEKQDEIAEQAVDESTASQDEVAVTNGARRRRNLSGTGVLRTQVADIKTMLNLSNVIETQFIDTAAGGDAFKSQFVAVANSIKNEEVEAAEDKKDNQCEDGFSLDPDTGLCLDDNPPEPPVVIEEEPEPELEWYLSTLDDYINIRIQKANGESEYVRWSIIEASNGSFEIQLNKEDLTSIQQGDQLVVNLEGLNKLDGGLAERQPPMDIDLSLFAPVIEQERVQSAATTSATSMLLLSTAIKIVTNGSMAELWGAINGMQIASNQPIISIEIARNAAEFSAAVAGIVTFDIPGLDMESAFGWAGLEMPEEDPILMDIDEGVVSDETEIGGVPWSELKTTFMHDPCWARKDCGKLLSDNEQTLLTRLINAQEAVGWELHDQRRIGYNQTWKDIKIQTMDPYFRESDWFAGLNDKQVALVENLRWAQRRQGNMSELILQPSPLGETPGSGQIFIDSLDLMGFANAYLSRGLGTAFLWILYASAGLLALLFLLPFGRFQFAQKAIDRLKGDFLWNVVLRTVMQTSLEFGFCCYFCLKYAEFDGSVGTMINFGYAYLFAILLVVIPFFFVIFYKMHFESFREIRYNRLAGLDENGRPIQYDEIAFKTCSDFYQDESMEDVIKKIIKGERKDRPVEITPLDKDQLEFLKSLQSLFYIQDAEIIRETVPHKAILELNGNFYRNFKADMERQVVRQEFMDKYGDPLEGFDLEKPVVIWFPTHFVMVRIVFVAGALLLWSNPMALLLLRLFTSLIGFIIVTNIKPLDSHRANKLEMMNEATVIFIVDCIIFCTDLLNAGNENDLNAGSTPDLISARAFIGSLYIYIFCGNITVHMSFLAYDQIRSSIGGCRLKKAMWHNKIRREKAFQKKNPSELIEHGIKYRPFWRGMCRRVFGTTAIYENVVIEDVKLGIRTGGAEVRHAKGEANINSDVEESSDKSVHHGLMTRYLNEPHSEPQNVDNFETITQRERSSKKPQKEPVPPKYSKSISQLIIPQEQVSKQDVFDVEYYTEENSNKKVCEQNINRYAIQNDHYEQQALNDQTSKRLQSIIRRNKQEKSEDIF